MKRYALLLAVLCLLLVLCSCKTTPEALSQDHTPQQDTVVDTQPEEVTVPSKETDPAAYQQARYDAAVAGLESYLQTGACKKFEVSATVYDSIATKYLYDEFCALGDFLDSADIAARFGLKNHQLQSVDIKITDNLENVTERNLYKYVYDSKGRLVETDDASILEQYGYHSGHTIPNVLQFEYVDADRVIAINALFGPGTIQAKITPTFNEDGQLIQTDVLTNTSSYTCYFTYDTNGNRISAQLYNDFYDELEDVSYVYDSQNQLIQRCYTTCIFNELYTTDYFYDENGLLIQSVENQENSVTSTAYELITDYMYDEYGILICRVQTPDRPEAGFISKEFTYTYTSEFGYIG